MMMKKYLFLLLAIFLIVECTSPYDRKYNQETYSKDIKKINDNYKDVDTFLLSMIIQYPDMYGVSKENLKNKTYRQIFNEGKKWRAKRMADYEKEKEIELKQLQESSSIKLLSKGFSQIDYINYLTYKLEIHNKSNKDIRAIKGMLRFNNLFNDNIKSLSFEYDQKIIPAGQKIIWEGQSDYSPYSSIITGDDVAFRNKALKDIKVIWEAESIIFTDGVKLDK